MYERYGARYIVGTIKRKSYKRRQEQRDSNRYNQT